MDQVAAIAVQVDPFGELVRDNEYVRAEGAVEDGNDGVRLLVVKEKRLLFRLIAWPANAQHAGGAVGSREEFLVVLCRPQDRLARLGLEQRVVEPLRRFRNSLYFGPAAWRQFVILQRAYQSGFRNTLREPAPRLRGSGPRRAIQ